MQGEGLSVSIDDIVVFCKHLDHTSDDIAAIITPHALIGKLVIIWSSFDGRW